jgi:hypothetical protein
MVNGRLEIRLEHADGRAIGQRDLTLATICDNRIHTVPDVAEGIHLDEMLVTANLYVGGAETPSFTIRDKWPGGKAGMIDISAPDRPILIEVLVDGRSPDRPLSFEGLP